MISWFIVGAVLLVLFVYFKASNFGQNFWMYAIIAGIVFFLATFAYISSQNEISFTNFDGVLSIGRIYFSWLIKLGGNVATLTGHAINVDWRPEFNSTLSTVK